MTEAKRVDAISLAPQPDVASAGDGLSDARDALGAALDKKALEPVLLDVRGLCSYTNYILTVSGRSDRQVDAIADGVLNSLRKRGIRPLGIEGKGSGQWVLLDFGDAVIHVFHHPVREHYDLEGLWIDASRVAIDVPAEARIPAEESY
ncbi:MAG: ribosome silencing factor [Proteobacteria bacterium]|nr:ribosome silencing factor [Pseudomonadota bacterium]